MALQYLGMIPGGSGGPTGVLRDRIFHSGSADIPPDTPVPDFPFVDDPATYEQAATAPTAATAALPPTTSSESPLSQLHLAFIVINAPPPPPHPPTPLPYLFPIPGDSTLIFFWQIIE
jgi:hypothetical protein